MNRRTLPSLLGAALLGAVTVLLLVGPGCKNGKAATADDPASHLTGGEAAYAHTRAILEFGPRPPGSSGLKKAQDYVIAQLAAHGWHCAPQSFPHPVQRYNPATQRMETVSITFRNLLARFGSPTESDFWTRPVRGVLGAHLDSKYYPDRNFLGADDAASAVGAILELARQLKASPELAARLELVIFDGEEAFGQNISPTDGLYGSKVYALRWRAAAQKPSFGIVLDMIGHHDLNIRFPADTPEPLEVALMAAARAEGVEDRFTRGFSPIIDDHVPLNDAGVPTIDIIGDFSQFDWWHTERDDLRTISKDSLAVSLRVTRRMLDALLATDP